MKVIFDNDGVNIDSEDVAMRVMDDWGVALVTRYKPDANMRPDYIYDTYPGTSTDRIVLALIKEFDLDTNKIQNDYGLDTNDLEQVSIDLADQITIETNQRFQQELKSISGVTKALTDIRQTYGGDNVALATTSRADRMDISLACAVDPVTGANAQLAQLFPEGELRRSGYGHANKYDEFYDATGWNPQECVVVEDSLSGVSKARAAGAARDVEQRVIGTVSAKFYTDKQAQADSLMDAGATMVISTMKDLPNALAWVDADLAPQHKPDFLGTVYLPEERASAKTLEQGAPVADAKNKVVFAPSI